MATLEVSLRVTHSTYERYSTFDQRLDAEISYDYMLDGAHLGRKRVDAQTRRLMLQDFYRICDEASVSVGDDFLVVKAKRIAERFWSVFLPRPVQVSLTELASGAVIKIETTDADVPWEMFDVGGEFMACRFCIARTAPTPVRQPSHRDKVRLCLVGDPTSDLPAARAEIDAIQAHGIVIAPVLESRFGVQLTMSTYLGTKATKSEVLLGELMDETGGVDVFHYAGHVEFDMQDPERSSMQLADSDLKAFECRDLPIHPVVVFINGCRSIRSKAPEFLPSIGMLVGMAGEFLRGGSRVYVGTLWAVEDTAGRTFAEAFYAKLLAGAPVSEAMKYAQSILIAAQGGSPIAGLAYLLFGDPAVSLMPQSPSLTSGPFINEAGIRHVIELERDFCRVELLVVHDLPWVLWSTSDIKSWVERLPLDADERRRVREMLEVYTSEFGMAISGGEKRLDCILSYGELVKYLRRSGRQRPAELCSRIEDLSQSNSLSLLLLDFSSSFDELEVVSRATDVLGASRGDLRYVFNKQTRLEDRALLYQLYEDSNDALVREYVSRFFSAKEMAEEFTRRLCETLGISWSTSESTGPVMELIQSIGQDEADGRSH